MFFSVDLGGSTVDIVEFFDDDFSEFPTPLSPPLSGGKYKVRAFLESMEVDKNNLEDIFQKGNINFSFAKKIVLTGGHSRTFAGDFFGIPIEVISEIDAIAMGGTFLANTNSGLVCSLGTGTCFVSVKNNLFEHVGGTGVGGGTLIGLSSSLLGTSDFSSISELVEKGDSKNVDVLVQDIVGEGIGIVPGTATASNLAKLSSASQKTDIAEGIANMVAQTIASLAVFTARTYEHENIILGGKLIRLEKIKEVAQKTAAIYGRNIVVPKNAEFLSAIGAGVYSCRGKNTLVPRHCEP